MRNIAIILLFASLFCYSQNVVVVSKTRANKLRINEATEDIYFNPILDSLGRWVVSKQEVDMLTDSQFIYLKTMPVIRFMKPIDTINILGR